VLGYSRAPKSAGTVAFVAFDDLLERSDVVIIHAPLTDETSRMFCAATIARMKRGAFLINVSRGPIIDNCALLTALEKGQLSGAGLDVVDGEPNPPRALVERPDVIVTPHVAFSSDTSLAELRRRSAQEVVRVLAGERPQFPCNSPR
jgi:D-3-phosphoglycerate dehydrogenase / 2-oxoglutarate reductase